MIVLCHDTGFRHMVAFFINIFCVSASGAVPDNAESFKFIAVRLHDVTVIDVDDRFIRAPLSDNRQIGA